jgi:predicted MPP superfamily phosphohydrolase
MPKLKLLWIDDDSETIRLTWEKPLRERLQPHGLDLEITYHGTGVGVRDLARDYDLLLLDIALGEQQRISTGFEVLQLLRESGIYRPAIIFSSHVARFKEQLAQYRGAYIGAFTKTLDDLRRLCESVVEFVKNPPLTLIMLSDLHVGLREQANGTEESYLEAIEEEFKSVAERLRPNYLVIAGDIVWTDQSRDLRTGERVVRRIRHALGLQEAGAVHFCPGNHDIVLDSDAPWSSFHHFVSSLADDDRALLAPERFGSTFGGVRTFDQPGDLLSVGTSPDGAVLFAALNSVHPDKDRGHSGIIGTQQWTRLRTRVKTAARDQLRIALMHHPLYPVPSDDADGEDRILLDSARAFRELHSLGFQLVINGHAHYSCVHAHELTVLNTHGSQPSTQRLVVVALPTFGGTPSPATPYRQYAILQIGHLRAATRTRSLRVQTRLYSYDHRKFVDGHVTQTLLGETEPDFR